MGTARPEGNYGCSSHHVLALGSAAAALGRQYGYHVSHTPVDSTAGSSIAEGSAFKVESTSPLPHAPHGTLNRMKPTPGQF